ncbi:hypothetical protein J6G99_05515 [bacterium]|nr:hypothetical protein [bacterium]
MKKFLVVFSLFIFSSCANAKVGIGTDQNEIFETFGEPDATLYDGDFYESWIYDSIKYKDCEFGSDKILTVIIKFDENKKVINFSYHN